MINKKACVAAGLFIYRIVLTKINFIPELLPQVLPGVEQAALL